MEEMKTLWLTCALRILFLCMLANCAGVLAADLPAGFEHSLVVSHLGGPTAMAFAPDGRLFVSDKYGKLLIIKNGRVLNTPFLEVETVQDGERGLQGIAFDPNFLINRYLYVFYTYAVGPRNRISRFRASDSNSDLAEEGSELVLVDDIATNNFHNGGALHFGIDGKLYASTGDAQVNTRSQSLGRLEGKILRIDPARYPNIIPPDNPFVNNTGAKKEIWARGLRNPFTFAIDQITGTMFINDVGASSWEEVDLGSRGVNYGWPNCEGSCTNSSYQNPAYAYAHADGNGECVAGGVFYRGNQFPGQYAGDYFFADFTANWIRRLDASNSYQVSTFATNLNSGPIDLDVGPDGSLYYLSLSTTSTDPSRYDGKVFKIAYIGGGNRSPVAVASANPTSGAAPLQVDFNGAGSRDPDNDALTYSWNFGDGSPSQSGVNVSYTYTTPAQYFAKLTVDDGRGGSDDSDELLIIVGTPPVGIITAPAEGTLYAAGDMIDYSATATDAEDGALPASALSWTVAFHHDTHSHPFLGPLNGVQSGSFIIPRTGETADDVFYRINLTVTDGDGIKHISSRDLLPRKSAFTVTSDPPGLIIHLDGQPAVTPLSVVGVVGITRSISAPSPQTLNGSAYEFASWSDGGEQTHSFDTPEVNTTYLATYRLVPASSTFSFLPSDDAFVKLSSPTSNNGSASTLRVRKTGSEALYSFLKFVVSGLGGAAQSAKLRLFVDDASADGGAVYAVSNNYQNTATPWIQSVLNWNNAPVISGTALSSMGAVSVGTWVEFDVTAAISGDGVYSFGLKNNSSDVVRYTSKEGSNKPSLIIQTSEAPQPTLPSISSFNPTSGEVGVEVTITGENFSGTISVKFNGVAATVFNVDSDEQIRVTVPSGATTGKLGVTTPNGTATSASNFTVNTGGGDVTSISFGPSDDGYVRSSTPTTSYGSVTALRVRKSSSDALNFYIKFAVSGLIGSIESAKLRLYVTDGSSDGGAMYAVSNNYAGTSTAWLQSILNWNNAPPISGTALGSVSTVTVGNWVEVDVTPAITGNGVYSFGVKNNSSDAAYYGSKETSNRPQLMVRGTFNTQAIVAEFEDEALVAVPEKFSLHQNYPNPFNPETRISYDLPESADVSLRVYNILGHEIALLVDEEQAAGFYSKMWNGRDKNGEPVGSGIYFYHLQAGSNSTSRKMLLLH